MMKLLLFFFFSFFLIVACQRAPQQKAEPDETETTDTIDTLPKATAIFWVDKRKWVRDEGILPLSTAKAKVVISEDGKVDLKSFVKPQDGNVQRYLRYNLEIFRVHKVMMDSGFVKPGEQYVQLRYMPEKAKKFK
ncbi:DUF4891 domain-containing protein [Bacteroides sp.]